MKMDSLQIEDNKCYKIYDGLKTLQLNKTYYGRRLDQLKRYNMILEILIASGASGSGIAGIAVLKAGSGQILWGVLSEIAIVLSIAKPFLKLSDRISSYAKLYGEFATAADRARSIADDIQVDHTISAARMKAFDEIRKRVGDLSGLGDSAPRPKIVKSLSGNIARPGIAS